MTALIICALVVWFCVSIMVACVKTEHDVPQAYEFGAAFIVVALIMGALGGSVIGLALLVRMAVAK